MHIYVCVCVHVSVCAYFNCVRVYVCMCVRVCVCMLVCKYIVLVPPIALPTVSTNPMHTSVCIYIHMYKYSCVCMNPGGAYL